MLKSLSPRKRIMARTAVIILATTTRRSPLANTKVSMIPRTSPRTTTENLNQSPKRRKVSQ